MTKEWKYAFFVVAVIVPSLPISDESNGRILNSHWLLLLLLNLPHSKFLKCAGSTFCCVVPLFPPSIFFYISSWQSVSQSTYYSLSNNKTNLNLWPLHAPCSDQNLNWLSRSGGESCAGEQETERLFFSWITSFSLSPIFSHQVSKERTGWKKTIKYGKDFLERDWLVGSFKGRFFRIPEIDF